MTFDNVVNIVVSILVGSGILAALLSVRTEKKKERRNKKAEAYANYIRVSEKYDEMLMGMAMTHHLTAYELEVEYAQACGELCIYATDDILTRVSQNHAKEEAISNYYNTAEGQQAYIAMIDAMRKEIMEESKGVSYNTIAGVMRFPGIRPGRFAEAKK